MATPARRLFLLVALSTATWLASAGSASARVEGDSPYSKGQTYSGALRYLRVDLGYEVVEKDADAAYLIFQYVPPGEHEKGSSGTVEIVETENGVKLYVELPKMPEYHERVLRDGLLRKLRDEYGAPPKRRPETPKPPVKDAGAG